MQKTSKTKSKGKVVNNKKNNKKNNSKKLSLVIIIVGIILIITGIGGYLLSNKGLPGGGFNIMKPQPVDDGGGGATTKITCNVSNCTKCSKTNYCSQCKSGYILSNGKCVKKYYKVTISVSNGKGSATKYVNKGAKVQVYYACNRNPNYENFGNNSTACNYTNSSGRPSFTYGNSGKPGEETFFLHNISGDVNCNIKCVAAYSCDCTCNLKTYGGTCTRDGASYGNLNDCNKFCKPAESWATAKCIETGTSRYTCRTYKQLSKQKEASCAKVLDSRWNGTLKIETEKADPDGYQHKYQTCSDLCKGLYGTTAKSGRCSREYDN